MPHVTKRPKKTPLKRNEDERQITLISPASDGVKSELSGNSWLSSLSSSTPTSLQSSSAALPSHTTRSAVTRSLHTSALSNTSISIKDEDLPSLKSEPRDIEDLPTSTTEPKKATVSKSTKSQSTKPQSKQVGESSQPPPNFERMYELIEEMRGPGGKAADAPVDTMGCALLGSRTAEPRTFRFQTLVALMLSAQTKDTVTAPAMEQLKARVKDNFSAQGVLDTDPAVIHDCIRQVGFHNNKLKYILAAARTCVDQYGGDIPDSLEGLCSLAGVGPKMAHLTMQAAWGRVEGIGVDVHVHRLCNMWGWVNTKTPEQTRLALESWLPRERWAEINHLLVGFGQTVCPAQRPHCRDCKLAHALLCPASTIKREVREQLKKEGKVKVEQEEEEGDVPALESLDDDVKREDTSK